MELKETTQPVEVEDRDYMLVDIDDMDEGEFIEDPTVKEVDIKVSQQEKNEARKTIEEIMEARALRRELADLFDDDLLLD